MVVLSAIGRFFKKIWDWIKQTAWIQPLLIVGIIFGVIFIVVVVATIALTIYAVGFFSASPSTSSSSSMRNAAIALMNMNL